MNVGGGLVWVSALEGSMVVEGLYVYLHAYLGTYCRTVGNCIYVIMGANYEGPIMGYLTRMVASLAYIYYLTMPSLQVIYHIL